MNVVNVIVLLLRIVNWLIKSSDDAQQQKIGKDKNVKKLLVQIALDARVARNIGAAVLGLSDDDVSNILRDQFRD